VIRRAHALDLKVVIDQVWSHTAAAHPWFRDSSASRRGAKADWYVWADPASDGSPPNNWLSVFGGSAWRWSPSRRQYYLHHFLPTQPKLNLRSDAVMAAHFANAEFWLERGVDGFRFDAIDFMLHDEALRDNLPVKPAPAQTPWNPFRLQHHVHDMCQPANQELMGRIRGFTDRFGQVITIGEISSEVGAFDRIAALTAAAKLHMAYTLGVMKGDFTPAMIRQAARDATTLNRSGWLCWSFSNHDVDRVVSRWNPITRERPAFARLAMALLLCLPGSVCLYQGEELGLPNARVPFDAIRDPFGQTFHPTFAGRDGGRTPIPWIKGAANSGFSRAPKTWLPVDEAHDGLAVDCQAAAPESTLAAYRQMLAWRKQHPALAIGDLELIEMPDPLVGWRRHLNDDRVVAVFNLAAEPVTIPMSYLPAYDCASALAFATSPEGDRLCLPPFGVSIGRERGN
jgi:alpha-glucosidase